MPPKRKRAPRSVWLVQWTSYEDDYKCRGDDWSSSDSYLCETEELAKEVRRRLMLEKLMETLPHRDIDEQKWPRLAKGVKDALDDEIFIEKELKGMHSDDINELFTYYCSKGEYIHVKEEIEITEKEVLQEIESFE